MEEKKINDEVMEEVAGGGYYLDHEGNKHIVNSVLMKAYVSAVATV